MSKRVRHPPNPTPDGVEIQRALAALSAAELRAALSTILEGADTRIRASIREAVMARTTKATAGLRPARPSASIVAKAQAFAEAARLVGHADADDVSEHLRRATRAFLAGDYASARAVFDAILPPLARAEIDLGQHELVDEVLSIDAQACVGQYVASVYLTTPVRGRADAVFQAAGDAQGIATLSSPIKELEDVLAGPVPDLEVFLPLWVKRLERFRPSSQEWETEHERWLREAVFRVEGIAGLARIARTTKRPQACLAWFDALADRRDWPAALRAADAGVRLVSQSQWRGELLDRAALAAQELRRPDLSKRLETAWKAAPTLTRLLRWLEADDLDGARFRAKVTQVAAVIQRTHSDRTITDTACDAALDAMKIAAEKRVAAILHHSRRRHYGHAASLVAACVAYSPKRRAAEFARWASTLREQHRRRHAFGAELARACVRLGVRLPAR